MLGCDDRGLGAVRDTKSTKNRRYVVLDRARAEVELQTDLPVAHSLCHKHQHLTLPSGQLTEQTVVARASRAVRNTFGGGRRNRRLIVTRRRGGAARSAEQDLSYLRAELDNTGRRRADGLSQVSGGDVFC